MAGPYSHPYRNSLDPGIQTIYVVQDKDATDIMFHLPCGDRERLVQQFQEPFLFEVTLTRCAEDSSSFIHLWTFVADMLLNGRRNVPVQFLQENGELIIRFQPDSEGVLSTFNVRDGMLVRDLYGLLDGNGGVQNEGEKPEYLLSPQELQAKRDAEYEASKCPKCKRVPDDEADCAWDDDAL